MKPNLRGKLPFLALSVLLVVGFFAPLAMKNTAPGFYFEVVLGGLMTGVMYALVALGFVLIYKASGVFNFAQGAMVLFAALSLARLAGGGLEDSHVIAAAVVVGIVIAVLAMRLLAKAPGRGVKKATSRWISMGIPVASGAVAGIVLWRVFGNAGWPMWLALCGAAAIMLVLSVGIEKLVLRQLVNQEGVVLLMATLGVAYFLEGFGQLIWGSDIYTIELGLPKAPVMILENVFAGGILVNLDDVFAAVLAAVLVAVLAVFFQRTPVGRALRAVADDHQAAQSIGIPLNTIWVIVWAVSGIVALVAGMLWGAKLGVQFSLALIALKALPVVILGGLTSVPGAILGGLIIGVGEKLSEVFIGPMIGGGIETWFAYALALVFLLVRPEGLFGEKHIDRV
jgi:branched-chain amino acid transport system permease protein